MAGGLGVTGQLQVGSQPLCSGDQQQQGAFAMGGAGLFGEAQITVGDDGSFAGTRGLLGIGPPLPGGAFGYVNCGTRYYCLK